MACLVSPIRSYKSQGLDFRPQVYNPRKNKNKTNTKNHKYRCMAAAKLFMVRVLQNNPRINTQKNQRKKSKQNFFLIRKNEKN